MNLTQRIGHSLSQVEILKVILIQNVIPSHLSQWYMLYYLKNCSLYRIIMALILIYEFMQLK